MAVRFKSRPRASRIIIGILLVLVSGAAFLGVVGSVLMYRDAPTAITNFAPLASVVAMSVAAVGERILFSHRRGGVAWLNVRPFRDGQED